MLRNALTNFLKSTFDRLPLEGFASVNKNIRAMCWLWMRTRADNQVSIRPWLTRHNRSWYLSRNDWCCQEIFSKPVLIGSIRNWNCSWVIPTVESFLNQSLKSDGYAHKRNFPYSNWQKINPESLQPGICTKGGNRTHTPEGTRFWVVRVYQVRHFGK